MKTLSLQEAADFLGMHRQTLRAYAAAKIIPGCKPGRSWRFIEDDLVAYMRSLYSSDASQGVTRRRKYLWHSSNDLKLGGLTLPTTDSEYEKALGLIKE